MENGFNLLKRKYLSVAFPLILAGAMAFCLLKESKPAPGVQQQVNPSSTLTSAQTSAPVLIPTTSSLPSGNSIASETEEVPQSVNLSLDHAQRKPAAESEPQLQTSVTDPPPTSEPVTAAPVTEPTETPAPVPTTPQALISATPQVASDEFVPTAMTLAPDYFFSKIRSTDISSGVASNLSSQLNTGLGFAYSQQWTPDFSTSLDMKFGYVSISPIADGGKTLDSSSSFVDSVGIGFCFGSPDQSPFFVKTEVSDSKELFEHATSSTSVAVDALSTPEFHVEPGFRVFSKRPLVLGMSFPLGVYLPSSTNSYTTKMGSSYGGKVFLLQDLGKGSKISTEAGFLIRNQNTSITTQSQSDLGAGIAISFPLGQK